MIKILNENFSEEIVNEIGKFTILWCNFEKEYCNTRCSSDKIRNISMIYSVDECLLRNLSKKLQLRVSDIEDISSYVKFNLIPLEADQPTEDDRLEMKKFVEYKGDNLLRGALLTIYRIRNNLLHGLKVISELNEQIELFKAMNLVLENLEKN